MKCDFIFVLSDKTWIYWLMQSWYSPRTVCALKRLRYWFQHQVFPLVLGKLIIYAVRWLRIIWSIWHKSANSLVEVKIIGRWSELLLVRFGFRCCLFYIKILENIYFLEFSLDVIIIINVYISNSSEDSISEPVGLLVQIRKAFELNSKPVFIILYWVSIWLVHLF